MVVRAGAVIPLLSVAPTTTMALAPELIELFVFVPEEDSHRTSVLYEDDGSSFAYVGGAYFWTTLELERTGDTLLLDGTVRGAGFSEFRRRHFRVVFANVTPAEVRLNGSSLSLANGAVVFENRGQPFHLTAKL
jgi:hypothetical protein